MLNNKGMKVIAILGSPRKAGNSATALNIMAHELKKEGIELEIVHIGNKNIRGCIACYKCFEKLDRKCIIDDATNQAIEKMAAADGIILTSPVYWSGIAGTMKSFLDRAFMVSAANGNLLRGKVGAALVSVRRTGGSATVAGLNNYITYAEMAIASSNYWNVVHGHNPGEMEHDQEGVQITKVLASNIAWMLKMREQGTLEQPPMVNKIMTNFIR